MTALEWWRGSGARLAASHVENGVISPNCYFLVGQFALHYEKSNTIYLIFTQFLSNNYRCSINYLPTYTLILSLIPDVTYCASTYCIWTIKHYSYGGKKARPSLVSLSTNNGPPKLASNRDINFIKREILDLKHFPYFLLCRTQFQSLVITIWIRSLSKVCILSNTTF